MVSSVFVRKHVTAAEDQSTAALFVGTEGLGQKSELCETANKKLTLNMPIIDIVIIQRKFILMTKICQ